jgi:ribosomal protein S18 acetylase RimI-like enzyme
MQQRAFAGQIDLSKLQIFLDKLRRQGDLSGTFLFGDLAYEMHHPLTGFDRQADIRIWEGDDGQIRGFVFLRPPDNPEFFLCPDLYGSHVEDEMIRWSLARATARGSRFIETSCLDRDSAKVAFLRRLGFIETDDVCVLMERSLADPLRACLLPEGHSVVTLAERPDGACGVPGSGMGRELYKHVQRAHGYKADLDVRAFYHDAVLASGCTCWYDSVGRYGQFQPVGTGEAHRRKGLAVAVMVRAMQDLQRYDADRVYVWTDKSLTSAVRLYQSLGFRIVHEDHAWKRGV